MQLLRSDSRISHSNVLSRCGLSEICAIIRNSCAAIEVPRSAWTSVQSIAIFGVYDGTENQIHAIKLPTRVANILYPIAT